MNLLAILAVFVGFSLFIGLMAVGVLFGRKPIAGSCGGLANVGINGDCKICGKKPGNCDPKKLGTDAAATIKASINAAPKSSSVKDPLDF